jgi:ABC-2 type transport system permease protein
LLSEEKENGTWRLVYTQTSSVLKYLTQKLLVAALLTTVILFSLFLSSIFIVGIPVDKLLLQFVGISLLYLLFWFVVSFFVISLSKQSGVNAIMLLSIWLLLTMVLPAAINNYISAKYPVPEAFSTMLKQRDGYHRKWDIPKEQTMQQFFAAYPKYKDLKWTYEGFDWLWYYAMQHCGDLDAQQDKKAFMQKLHQRNATSNTAALFIPSINVQSLHNELSQSSLLSSIEFLDSTAVFHENLRQYFYPKIFAAAPVSSEDWSKYSIVYKQQKQFSLPVSNIVSLCLYCLVLVIFGVINLKRITH